MSASNWHGLSFLASIVSATLICCPVSAGEEGLPKPALVLDDPLPGRLAEVTWSLLETIEQYHISPPSRESVMAAVAKAVCEGDPRHAQVAAVRLVSCRSQAEFVSTFIDLWPPTHNKNRSEDSYLGLLSTSLPDEIAIVPAAEYAVQEQLQNNRYVGLGVAVSSENGSNIVFSSVIPGRAADRAGLVNGETVLEVDGHDTTDVPAGEVISKWLRGPKGTQVTLKLGPRANHPAREVTLTRSVVRIDSVHGRNGASVSRGDFRDQPSVPIGYLQVRIKSSTLQELRDAETRLHIAGIRVLILDLRSGDSSTSFHHVKLVADGLLDGGTMWSWQDRSGQRNVEVADRECLFRNLSLVVVVDQSTGTMQTAIAAALQDAGRAVIVGEPPRQRGLIFASHAFASGQYYARFACASLFRSRADRSWPLQPDHSTGDAAVAATSESIPVRRAAREGRINLASTPDLEFYSRRGVEPTSRSVSALFPANLQEIEILRRLGIRAQPHVSPTRGIQHRTVQDDAARKVALQLLQKVYEQDKEIDRNASK